VITFLRPTCFEVINKPQVAELDRQKPVPEGQQDHGRVPVPVAVRLGGLDQGFDLSGRQVLLGSKFGVRTGASVRFTSVGRRILRMK
jgi:hypothetical protein